jgi:hypothetical protein
MNFKNWSRLEDNTILLLVISHTHALSLSTSPLYIINTKYFKVKVTLRLMASQSVVSLGVKPQQSRSSLCGTPLWRKERTLNWPYTKLSLSLRWLMLVPPGNLWQIPRSTCKTRYSVPLAIFQGAHQFAKCTWLSTCVRVWLCHKIMQATSRSHSKSWQWKFSLYWRRRSPTQNI